MTRDELHALVWSQPMRTAAKSMGISDVALAKRCRNANVPVPPRGWWARKEAGKQVKIAPLPPLPFAMADYFPAIDRTAQPGDSQASAHAPISDEEGATAAPVFRDLAAVSEEIRRAVGAIKVPQTLASPHPFVARLLKQDEARKAVSAGRGYVSDYYGPKFTSPVQQRRLRILSCILDELQRLGCKIHGSTHAGERFSVNVGGHWTYILFGVEGGASMTPFHRDSRRGVRADKEQLRFDLTDHDDRTLPARTWRESEKPLELQAVDIVCGLFLRAEEDTRKWTVWLHNDRIQQRAREAREAKIAAEKAAADRIAREKAAAAARIEMLIEGAEALELAARIRRYVTAVRSANDGMPDPLPADVLEAWSRWALAEADRIDPVISRQFLSHVETQ